MSRRLRLPSAAIAVLLAVGAAQAADAVTFLRMMRDVGPGAEANPLVAALAGGDHLLALVIAKAGLVSLVVGVVSLAAVRHPVIAAVVATLAVGAGLVGAWSNVLVLLDPVAG
jgi:hypothetical protein